jgi:hypothetical protein
MPDATNTTRERYPRAMLQRFTNQVADLEYDKESKTHHDMGDKKATAKTSQALREGLKKIRQQIYSKMEIGRYQSGFDKDCLGSLDVTPVPLPAKRYFECSVQILQSLCNTR